MTTIRSKIKCAYCGKRANRGWLRVCYACDKLNKAWLAHIQPEIERINRSERPLTENIRINTAV